MDGDDSKRRRKKLAGLIVSALVLLGVAGTAVFHLPALDQEKAEELLTPIVEGAIEEIEATQSEATTEAVE